MWVQLPSKNATLPTIIYSVITMHFSHCSKKLTSLRKVSVYRMNVNWRFSEKNKKVSKLFSFPYIFCRKLEFKGISIALPPYFKQFYQVYLRSQPPEHTRYTPVLLPECSFTHWRFTLLFKLEDIYHAPQQQFQKWRLYWYQYPMGTLQLGPSNLLWQAFPGGPDPCCGWRTTAISSSFR